MDIESATVPQLLTQYAEILAELRKREVVRTRNAPIGDYAEFLSAAVYDGALEPNSGKSHDLIAADGRLVQVKARTIDEGVSHQAFGEPKAPLRKQFHAPLPTDRRTRCAAATPPIRTG